MASAMAAYEKPCKQHRQGAVEERPGIGAERMEEDVVNCRGGYVRDELGEFD
jgi:hypothetical protein